MAYITNTLQSIDNTNLYKGFSFKYDNYLKTDKLRFVPEPKRQPKTKTLVLPLLEFNPQYNMINKTISDANLAEQIKENYENVKYIPITSSGYRGFSALNSRRNGVKEGFNDNLLKQMSSFKYAPVPPPQPQPPIKKESPKVYIKQEIPGVLTRMSFPPRFNPPDLPTSSDEGNSPSKSNYGSDIFNTFDKNKTPRRKSESDYGSDIFNSIMNDKNKTPTRKNSQSGSGTDLGSEIFDAINKEKYLPPNKRTFAKLKKEAKKAETQQRKESTPGPSYSSRKGKGVGRMPSASNYKKDSDEEMNS